jgi:hypothetical protein
MRYFLVKYVKTPQGQMDEIVGVSKRIKTNDLQTSSVILDFRTQQVVLASLDGTTIPRDWWKIRDFYHQHYGRMIEDLEAFHGLKIVRESASPDKDPESE